MPGFTVRLRAGASVGIDEVGGKGASLVALAGLEGVWVPDAFCVTTRAWTEAVEASPGFGGRVGALEGAEGVALRDAAAAVRAAIEGAELPPGLTEEVEAAVAEAGPGVAWAVRSSATAEDLPGASFAGQHESFLGVVGAAEILAHVRRCQASLYTDHAVAYRQRQGFAHRRVRMAVVVQRMVPAEAAGVLFTADPLTGNRRVSVVEAVRGLGDALVSGRHTPDHVELRDGRVQARVAPDGPVLDDAALGALERLGRRVEAAFGAPQDIEWCRVGDAFAVVQSRPITTLYPVPDAGDTRPRVYLSVGHQQMMTDAMRPLGLSLFRRFAARPMLPAGGRLFVDATEDLTSPTRGPALLGMMDRLDPLSGDAIHALFDRGFLVRGEASGEPPRPPPPPGRPADRALVAELVAAGEAGVAATTEGIAGLEGTALLDFLDADLPRLRAAIGDPRSFVVVMAATAAAAWLDDHLAEWLGERHVADTLSRSVPDNVGAEMGLALLDVADAIRPHPEVVAWLADAPDAGFLDGLERLRGGPEARRAIAGFLDRHGVRCTGEIDVTRPRWWEAPTALVPVLLSNVRSFAPGEAARRFEAGRLAAEDKRAEVLARLRALPDGEARAAETDTTIERLRALTGYREYPKYAIVKRLDVYRRALRAEAQRLTRAGVLDSAEDLDFLHLEELRAVVTTGRVDGELVRARRARHARDQALTPPRVLTSEGEAVRGAYRRAGLPAGALVGLAVSTGVVEGRARVVRELGAAELEPGDILVTAFTDPGWTAAFVVVAGLVTEVGGRMTHGAVIAREYGLPAVVAVADATRRIRDGQRIRVDGTEGTVEILG